MKAPLVSLGHLLKLERRKIAVDANGMYPEVGVYCFGRGLFHKLPRLGIEVGDKHLFEIRDRDFILQVTFAWEGAVAVARKDDEGFFGSVRVLTFRADEERCIPEYLQYYFRTPAGLEQLGRISPGSAGRNRVLSAKRIPEIMVPLPPLSEQRRIVAKIEQLAAKIEEARRLKQQSTREADALLNTTLSRILSDNTKNANWEFGNISFFAEINPSRQGKVNFAPTDLVSFIPMKALDDVTGAIQQAEVRQFLEVSKGYTWFVDGDIIFAKITPCMENGKAALARNLKNGVGFGSTEFHVIRVGPKILADWLHRIVRSEAFRNDAATHFKGTAGQQRVPQSFLERKNIAVPPLDEQRRIVAYLDSLQAKVDRLKALQAQTAAELEALLPSILDKAFKGEL